MPLYTTHRPTDLSEFVGNLEQVQALDAVLSRESDIPHAFLFTGPAGIGKTTLALIIKSRLGCHPSDVYQYNSANTTGIDTIRAIDESSRFSPMGGKSKIYILEECHQLSPSAQESLLKLLEDSPKYAYFTLTTTEPNKLKPSLKRRCHHCTLNQLTTVEIERLLSQILEKEGVQEFPKPILEKIISNSDGSPGIALNLLDKVIDLPDEQTALKVIDEQVVPTGLPEIVKALLSGNAKWKDLSDLAKNLEGEAESLRYAFLGYLNKILLGKPNPGKIADLMLPFTESVMYTGRPGLNLAIYMAWTESIGGVHG